VQWLTLNNYYVFDNVSGLGPCDVIAMNEKGNITKIDIKSESIRKTGKYKGYKINRSPSVSQKNLGIKLLMVKDTGECYFYEPQRKI
jgi:hypothetical protein